MVVMLLLFCNGLVALRNLRYEGSNSTLVNSVQISAENPFLRQFDFLICVERARALMNSRWCNLELLKSSKDYPKLSLILWLFLGLYAFRQCCLLPCTVTLEVQVARIYLLPKSLSLQGKDSLFGCHVYPAGSRNTRLLGAHL